MADRSTTLLAWIGGGLGIILVYAAYKNVGPVSIITGRLTGDSTRTTIDNQATVATVSGGYGGDVSTDTTVPASTATLTRTQQLAARSIKPILIPIPTQPTMQLDYSAVGSFMLVQRAYGAPIPITGGYRSYAEQARGYAEDSDRFAPPGKSLHEVGLAVDVNTDKVDVNSPTLIKAFTSHGWYRVGKSGPMHWSYGVPG